MDNISYIGYKDGIGDIARSGTAFAATAASAGPRALASGGFDIAADVQLATAALPLVLDLFTQWTSHPAADARDFIKNLKPKLVSADPYNRLVQVMAGDDKINHRAKDVSARELVLWYRQSYPNDYMQLTPDAKTYFNNYLNNAANAATDVNQASRDYKNAKFTTNEVNYNATPVQAATNIFNSATSGTTNWVLYGAIGLGLLILFSKK
jgi:hypothetical protein